MAERYIITTDNTTDLPQEFVEAYKLPCLHIDYTIDNVCYDGALNDLTSQQFYDKMRAGSMPITQQANPEKSMAFFRGFLEQGLDILHIAFGSGLSGTYNSNCIAARELREEFPNRRLLVVDSLCASMGEGLLVAEALRLQQEGCSLDQLHNWLEQNRLKLVHDVMADDLYHLQRGGRVSKTAAVVGTALGIKPLIHLDHMGKLVPYSKVRGKKTALTAMADRLAKRIDTKLCTRVFISHSDALADAQMLQKLIEERTSGITEFILSYIGPTIGAHTGTGTVALFYFSKDRTTD